jgi:SAM-dependent methyltransferase
MAHAERPAGQWTRWHEYYANAFKPWDTERCSSQLLFYLASCARSAAVPPCPAPLDFQDLQDDDEGSSCASVPYHHCEDCQHLKPHLLPGGATALELGCGTGASCVALAAAGFQVVGVDLVPGAVEAAARRAQQAGVAQRCTFLCADCFQLPQGFSASTAAGSAAAAEQPGGGAVPAAAPAAPTDAPASPAAAPGFDLVYDCQTYHVLRTVDAAGAVQLYRRLLRPGGLLMLLTGNADEPYVGPGS